MLVVIGPEWRHLFNDPDFRLGWIDARVGAKAREGFDDRIFYTHGRQMALECGSPLPAVNEHRLTPEMHRVVMACTAFVDMVLASETTAEQAARERAELLERLTKAKKATDEARAARQLRTKGGM